LCKKFLVSEKTSCLILEILSVLLYKDSVRKKNIWVVKSKYSWALQEHFDLTFDFSKIIFLKQKVDRYWTDTLKSSQYYCNTYNLWKQSKAYSLLFIYLLLQYCPEIGIFRFCKQICQSRFPYCQKGCRKFLSIKERLSPRFS